MERKTIDLLLSKQAQWSAQRYVRMKFHTIYTAKQRKNNKILLSPPETKGQIRRRL